MLANGGQLALRRRRQVRPYWSMDETRNGD
jgi:hypothetical protein